MVEDLKVISINNLTSVANYVMQSYYQTSNLAENCPAFLYSLYHDQNAINIFFVWFVLTCLVFYNMFWYCVFVSELILVHLKKLNNKPHPCSIIKQFGTETDDYVLYHFII